MQPKLVVDAFISSRLDYCNSLVFGITGNLITPAITGSTKSSSLSFISHTEQRDKNISICDKTGAEKQKKPH